MDRVYKFVKRRLQNQKCHGRRPVKEDDQIKDPQSSASKLTVDPWGSTYLLYSLVASVAVIYNVYALPVRSTFREGDVVPLQVWFVADAVADGLYWLDMIVQTQTGFVNKYGILETKRSSLLWNYLLSGKALLDVLSAVPMQYLSFFYTIQPIGMYRANTLLRVYKVNVNFITQCYNRIVHLSSRTYQVRFLYLTLLLLTFMHWNTCWYYEVSKRIGLSSDVWVLNTTTFSTIPQQYFASMYWVTAAIIGVGGVPYPVTDVELILLVSNCMIGVFYVAKIVGETYTIVQADVEKQLGQRRWRNNLGKYMKRRGISQDLQDKIMAWIDHSKEQNSADEKALLFLPQQSQTEINMDIHLETLRKVRLFQACEPELLVDLVNKIKLQIFCPEDKICTRGEVGKEMYIVKSGLLDVIAFDGKTLITTLKDGTVFGELALLNIPGAKLGNRRTTTVVSRGYSHLYILSREDLWAAFEKFPGAKEEFNRKGREILKKDGLLTEQANQVPLDVFAKQVQERYNKLVAKALAFETEIREYSAEVDSTTDRIEQRMNRIGSKTGWYDICKGNG